MKKIYLAAPLFSLAEQEFNNNLFESLKSAGYLVFLPQKECTGLAVDKIFNKCREGIDSAEIIIAILDGADADSGTCWECGYGYAKGKHIVAVRTDFRKSGDTDGYNAMLFFCANKVITGNNFLHSLLEHLKTL